MCYDMISCDMRGGHEDMFLSIQPPVKQSGKNKPFSVNIWIVDPPLKTHFAPSVGQIQIQISFFFFEKRKKKKKGGGSQIWLKIFFPSEKEGPGQAALIFSTVNILIELSLYTAAVKFLNLHFFQL